MRRKQSLFSCVAGINPEIAIPRSGTIAPRNDKLGAVIASAYPGPVIASEAKQSLFSCVAGTNPEIATSLRSSQ